MKTVELRPAFNWTCEECGRDQFERTMAEPTSKQEVTQMEESIGGDSRIMRARVRMLKQVKCKECGAEFGVNL